jgi:cell division protein FtsB
VSDPANPSSHQPANGLGVLVSLAFWLSLLTAAAMYAGATIAPKTVSLQRREDELTRQSQRVEALATRVGELELVAEALQNDPDYISASARKQLGTKADGETLIPVESRETPAAEDVAVIASTWPSSMIARIAGDSLLRARMLTAAGALILLAFTFLHERSRPTAIQSAESWEPLAGPSIRQPIA